MHDYKQLNVWRNGFQLTLQIYSVTKTFPTEERFGLSSQMRRAAGSIIANIAEGYRQPTRKAYLRFIHISFGSASELETHLLLSAALGYMDPETKIKLMNELTIVLKMLNRLIQTLSVTIPHNPRTIP